MPNLKLFFIIGNALRMEIESFDWFLFPFDFRRAEA